MLLLGMKAPPVVKRRGRPKGHMLTVCGLPAKKGVPKKLTTFSLMHSSQKEKGNQGTNEGVGPYF